MYRCNYCEAEFEKYRTLKEPTGEKIYVCPFCKDTDFDEIQPRDENDNYLYVKKYDVIDFVLNAIFSINVGHSEIAKETLVELIKEMVDDTFFDYKDSIDYLTTQKEVDSLLEELMGILEVKTV